MHDYIPRIDNNFTEWVHNFTEYAAANAASLGLSTDDVNEMQILFEQWKVDFMSAYEARAHYLGLAANKRKSRQVTEQYVRQLVRQIQAKPDVTDGLRAGLGITIRDKIKTKSRRPEDAPSMLIDWSRSQCHIIHWGLSPGNERINGKPKGVSACEIRYYVGIPPVNMVPDDFSFATIATKSPAVLKYTEHLRETIYYCCRYLNTRMEPGPWGAGASAILGV